MDTPTLILALKEMIAMIPEIKEIKEGIHHPRVKAWRTRVLDVLSEGGKACEAALRSMKKMGLETLSLEDTFVNRQSYIGQLETIERALRQTLQTVEVFGRPEDRDILPHWEPPSVKKAKGTLNIGDEEVDAHSISQHEILTCFVAFVKASNDLTEEMRAELLYHLTQILNNDLYQPFFSQKLDVLLAHWPESSR
ncbi:MAG: hypothetical protein KDC35_07140 [Acidobacteria bacterium]|nr:hypothetical protein [Acidobacteriota bacterium]